MYKFLLAIKYLKTRYIAFASILSVTLGVATMIVVNSVMAGFSTEMQDRLRGLLSDITVSTHNTDGFDESQEVMRIIEESVGGEVVAMTPTVEMWGMMVFPVMGSDEQRPIRIVGIVPEGKNLVSPLSNYLLSRQLKDLSNKDQTPLVNPSAPVNWDLYEEAVEHRKKVVEYQMLRDSDTRMSPLEPQGANNQPVQTAEAENPDGPMFVDPWVSAATTSINPEDPQPARIIVGSGLVSYPEKNRQTGEVEVRVLVKPGEDVTISTLKAGTPQPVSFKATVVDLFKCGMSEYDSNLVFCNLEQLQRVRGMLIPPNPERPHEGLDWRNGSITSIQIKLKDYSRAPLIVQRLREELIGHGVMVETWEQQQGPLLQAVAIEAAILNVLLFLIIAVAGFGILAIFYMIVVEKTRDIGILKALGASSRGVMSIFLCYGLTLGIVGSGAGVLLGLLIVRYIDQVEAFVSWCLGHKVFDETIYYFHQVPTKVNPSTVIWVALGAVLIAVVASILPARRAASLDPVRALRYE